MLCLLYCKLLARSRTHVVIFSDSHVLLSLNLQMAATFTDPLLKSNRDTIT